MRVTLHLSGIFLLLLARKSRQNASGLLVGDFYFGEVEAAEIKPLLNRALFLAAYQTLC